MKDPQGSASTIARIAIKDRSRLKPPCGDCIGCCCGMAVEFHPGDDPSLFNENGELPVIEGLCVYLVDHKCSIYDKRPQACRHFDCRLIALSGLTHEEPEVADAVANWDMRKFIRSAQDSETIGRIRKAVRVVMENPTSFKVNVKGEVRFATPEDMSAQFATDCALSLQKSVEPPYRTLTNGKIKDTLSGEVHEPFSESIHDYPQR